MASAPATTPTGPSLRESAQAASLKHHLPVEIYVLGFTMILWLGLIIFSKYFLTPENVSNMMRQVSIDAIIAYGELLPIILAGIDLSVGSVAALTGIVFAMMLAAHVPVLLALVAAVALGLLIGLVNGLAIDRLGIPPFIVTLAGLQAFRGLTFLVSGGMTIAGMPSSLDLVARTSILGIPTMFVIMVLLGLVAHFILRYTPLGRYMYAIGSNAESARRVGINVTRVTLFAYCFSALFATVGGMMLVSRLTMGNPNAGVGSELQAIAAAVVGGASLFGGRGTILGCFIGAVLFTTIGNGANLLGVSSFWQMVIEGLLIALVVYVDNIQKKKQAGLR